VADNQLTTLPPSLSCLTALDQLSAYGNQLTEVPVSALSSCNSLSKLWLEGNPLTGEAVRELLGAVQALPKVKAVGLDVRQVSQVQGTEELRGIGSKLKVSSVCVCPSAQGEGVTSVHAFCAVCWLLLSQDLMPLLHG
jgi:hypothetical protein